MRTTPRQVNPEVIDEITAGIGDAGTRSASVQRAGDGWRQTALPHAQPTGHAYRSHDAGKPSCAGSRSAVHRRTTTVASTDSLENRMRSGSARSSRPP